VRIDCPRCAVPGQSSLACGRARGRSRQFHGGELARFRRHSKETRASLNSYLVATVELAETAEAGRRFHDRLAQEKNDERDAEP